MQSPASFVTKFCRILLQNACKARGNMDPILYWYHLAPCWTIMSFYRFLLCKTHASDRKHELGSRFFCIVNEISCFLFIGVVNTYLAFFPFLKLPFSTNSLLIHVIWPDCLPVLNFFTKLTLSQKVLRKILILAPIPSHFLMPSVTNVDSRHLICCSPLQISIFQFREMTNSRIVHSYHCIVVLFGIHSMSESLKDKRLRVRSRVANAFLHAPWRPKLCIPWWQAIFTCYLNSFSTHPSFFWF